MYIYIYIAYIKIQSNHTGWPFLQSTWPMLALASGRPVLQHWEALPGSGGKKLPWIQSS